MNAVITEGGKKPRRQFSPLDQATELPGRRLPGAPGVQRGGPAAHFVHGEYDVYGRGLPRKGLPLRELGFRV